MTSPSLFEPELTDRLRKIYDLGRKPRDPRDFFILLRASSMSRSREKKFVDIVKSGKAVIGQSNHPTKDWIILKSEKKVFTWCSYDTLMTAILQKEGEIGSSCPHCGEEMRILIHGGKLESFSPRGIVFLWGTGPEGSPGDPMCDHLHLFPGEKHMTAWLESHEGEMGFSFRLEETVNYLRRRF
jgi:hypothetical protein